MYGKRLIICFAALLLVATGCRPASKTERRPAGKLAAAAANCNVLLLTLDTTRADRLGCYGWQKAVTPVLDALAQRGTRFEQTFCQVPITLPSHTVLLTGLYPPETGVHVNGRERLGETVPTLAEAFQQHGYQTAAFIAAGVLHEAYGLSRGFGVYDHEFGHNQAGQPRPQRPANEVCDRALAWLQAQRGSRFMCWVHLFDPHTPYEAPPEFVRRTSDPYDAEVAFMDSQIGRLVEWLRSEQLLAKTLIIAVGDHGEALGDHGYDSHALLLYDGIMHVPFLVSLPGRLPESHVATGVVRCVDLVPTVLDLMGWPAPTEVSGESLLADLSGQEQPQRASYGETDYGYESYGWSKLRSLTDARWKYIRAPRPELYDRLADPQERRNQAAEHPDVVLRMERALARFEAGMSQHGAAEAEINSRTSAALRSLGYVAPSSPPATQAAQLKDPKDMVSIAVNYRRARDLLGAGLAAEAIELMEPGAERSPESTCIIETLGRAYAMVRRLEEAQRCLSEALSRESQNADTHYALAGVLALRGRFPASAAECRQALELEETHEKARQLLVSVKEALARQQAEIAACRTALETRPDDVELCVRLSNLLIDAGNVEQARQQLRDGLARQPEHPALANNLAWLLATCWRADLRDGREAVRLARIACGNISTTDPSKLDTLAVACAEAGEFAEAVETARRAAQLARAAGNVQAAERIERRAALFERGQAYHELP
ncbi:MAG: sulfatase-like hydrolase/transferase [Planctomycetes bacterium]|nr:sulfatase-like hydrolase/transferase [Planctomycetota bacterium]